MISTRHRIRQHRSLTELVTRAASTRTLRSPESVLEYERMRKLVATENLSLDGVMAAPETWAPQFQGPDFQEEMSRSMGTSDTMILGRKTFEEFAAFWPDSDLEPFASHMRNIEKYVVSTTLESAEWGSGNPVPIIGKNLVEEVREIKSKGDRDIGIIGSGTLVRSLLSKGLLDELNLCIHPIILGTGKRLFSGDCTSELTLQSARQFSSSIVMLRYIPRR